MASNAIYKKEDKDITRPSAIPLPASKANPMTALKNLNPQKKRQVWEGIKEEKPELAKLMQGNDPFLNALMTEFDGVFVLPNDEITGYLKKTGDNKK